ncbi:Lipopolysaccharide export system protein LptC [Gammaproteobacteria bacterium]
MTNSLDWVSFLKWFFLILGAAGSFWLSEVTAPSLEKIERSVRHEQDYFATKLVAKILDNAGPLRYRLEADFVQHFPDDDSTDLTNPYFVLFREGVPSWMASAKKGQVSAKGETVWLRDQVQIRRPPDMLPWAMDTSELRLHPKEQFAETDRALEIRSQRQTVNAVGMKAFFSEKRVELLSQVRGRHAPR